jgi:bifunctional non-homologous end joining protein LigD
MAAKSTSGTGNASERLRHYQDKRDFSKTSEPSGSASAVAGPPAEGGWRFVVQRHRARALHYDLRLEMDGVLVSWSVPKGPTLDPKAKRMAVHVEDHPVEYFDFEGTIPRGEYGAGDVIVWDWGTWELAAGDDPVKAVEAGDLHFAMEGDKLHGRFALVRRGQQGEREQWLLIHKRDAAAVDGWNAEDHPKSVKSGLTNDEVKAAPSDTWTSDRPTRATWATHTYESATPAELAALDELGKEGLWTVGGRELKLTNLDKVLFPASGAGSPKGGALTKRDLIRYHATVARWMLPYLAGRPVNPNRFPNGVDKPGFFHKAVPSHAPEWLTRFHYADARKGETEVYAVVDSLASLVWMANYGAVELNPWTSRVQDVHRPTWAMIDIDPGPQTTFEDVLVLARLYRVALDHVGVAGMPKVTGKRGVQIWVPVADRYSFEDTRVWVEGLSRAVGASVPDLVSWSWRKGEREGLARLDYTQNAVNKTLVAPFSARPAPGAPVSMTITWDELDDPDLRPDRWTVTGAVERLSSVGDPLWDLLGLQQALPAF